MPPHMTRARRPIATALTLLPCILAISLFTAIQHLYHSRRRLTPEPVAHPVLLFRDPRHCLSHPANRVFNVRADRNILAAAPLAHCFFEAHLLESECRFVARVERRKMKDMLAWMMDVKRGCDARNRMESPMPWGTEGTAAAGVEEDWVRLVAKGLRGERRRLRGTKMVEEEEEGWFEIWEGTVMNRCEGWVVEPEHVGCASLEDDDEEPFTWVNSVKSNLRFFDGGWLPTRRRRDEMYRIF